MGLRTWLGIKKQAAPVDKPVFHDEFSYSQLLQDRWVLHELGNKKNGFFVEVGAFDGTYLSNSLLLERDYSWTGVLVEPNPNMSDKIRSTRSSPLDVRPVHSVSGSSVLMRFVVGAPELSSMAERAYSDGHAGSRRKESIEIEQVTVSLSDLLDFHNSPRDIDYISIDTEGNELDILKSLDFVKYNVKLFTVEHNFTGSNRKIEKFLSSKGYERVYRDWSQFDGWYRKR